MVVENGINDNDDDGDDGTNTDARDNAKVNANTRGSRIGTVLDQKNRTKNPYVRIEC